MHRTTAPGICFSVKIGRPANQAMITL